jgi:hypothetical protein
MRNVRTVLAAVLLICAEATPAISAQPTPEEFETIDRIGAAWAYNAFLEYYPTGAYADLARERIARLVASRPIAIASRSPGAVRQSGRAPAEIDFSARVREPGYGDAYFMRRTIGRRR